ncbi:hypothetical protein KY361_02860 [Candidatus Woesearchaeota archaeon]|nr:hypothetical protein [Candidatus Woesearchaeota archaeon]
MKNIFIIVLALVFLTGCATVKISRGNIEALDETPTLMKEPVEQPEVDEPPEEPPKEPLKEEPEPEEPPEVPQGQTSNIVGVNISSGKFIPGEVAIKPGDTVEWTNQYEVSIMISGPKDTFSAKLGPEESYSYTFEEPGKYSIIKLVDPIFFGRVFVEE